ncbi:MAG: phosphohistidine phosphatase SixA [Bacteroidales bacterium]|nr:phosphohistidine phosphatase SixA [Bacteroidales bacterium]
MKTLYIVRHAKSSWDNPGLADHERPILEKGKNRTKWVCDYLIENDSRIDLIISSHAVRARQTATVIGNALNYPEDNIRISTTIYHGDIDSLLDHLSELQDDVNSVMMVGHNPTFTTFANYFLHKEIDWLPTSGIVCIEFDTDKWENFINAQKKAKFVITPRLLKEKKRRKI